MNSADPLVGHIVVHNITGGGCHSYELLKRFRILMEDGLGTPRRYTDLPSGRGRAIIIRLQPKK